MTSAIASMDMMPCRASGSASGASWARTRRWLFRNDCRGASFDADIRSDLQFAVFAIFVRSADTTSSTIRKITPAGVVTTVVGISGQAGFAPGALPGVLALPLGVAISGNSLFITLYNGVAVVGLP